MTEKAANFSLPEHLTLPLDRRRLHFSFVILTASDRKKLSKTLSYANGYRELEMWNHALAELDSLGAGLGLHPDALQMRLAVLMGAERWTAALPIANELASLHATDVSNWVNLAYVTRRAHSISEARIVLERALERFPEEAILHYNLGCYACCQRQLMAAKRHLLKSFQLDPKFLDTSYGDEDLAPLRDWLDSQPDDDGIDPL